MGFLDKLKGKQGELTAKARELAVEHGDKVEKAIDKVGDTVDHKTKGKYGEKIDSAQAKAKDALEQERLRQGKADPLATDAPVAQPDTAQPDTAQPDTGQPPKGTNGNP